MKLNITDDEKDLIARCWVRHHSDPQTDYILHNRLPEPDYKIVLSVDGDIWPFEDSPFDVLCDFDFKAPDIAYDIVLRIAGLTDDPWLLELLAAGPLEDLISHHKQSKKYLMQYNKLVATSEKHRHLLSMVWF